MIWRDKCPEVTLSTIYLSTGYVVPSKKSSLYKEDPMAV